MLLRKSLIPALSAALILGFATQPADAAAHKHHKTHHAQTKAKQGKLHPVCKNILTVALHGINPKATKPS